MRNIIKPFEKVGELKFGMDRNFINTSILKKMILILFKIKILNMGVSLLTTILKMDWC
ncbi:hypothetical protein CAPN003_17980 [Capnocytophaga stomatis]|nr:hypothetical protein CAPN003_17980 [Capnocytophaga stomatis]